MRNPFELYELKRRSDLYLDTSRNQLQIDQLPIEGTPQVRPDFSTHMRIRLRWAGLFTAFIIVVLLGRLMTLQIARGDEFLSMAEGNRLRIQRIPAARGVFFDRNGTQLVQNIPDFSVILTPRDIPLKNPERSETVQRIADVTHLSTTDINTQLENHNANIPSLTLLEHIDYEDAIQMIVAFQAVPGVEVETRFRRTYTQGAMYSHLLGYMGKITEDEWIALDNNQKDYPYDSIIGKIGLEYSYESVLRGEDGKRTVEVNALGKEQVVVSSSHPIAGSNIILSIDGDLQQVTQTALDTMTDKNHGVGGAAIALNPQTGEVLALASTPSFDNELFARGITQDELNPILTNEQKPLLNRVIAGEYPSGSTFKPVVAAAGLAEKVITSATTILSVGGIDINGSFFPDWRAGGHGVTDVRKALADSVNSFFYLLGGGDNTTTTGLGVERITDYARKFGLGSPVGIDLPGEQSGFLPSKAWKEETKNEVWYIGDTYHLAIGQGDILVTPLQVASYTMAIANGGTVWKPHVAKTLVSQDGTNRQDILPEAVQSNIIDDTSLAIVRSGMRQAVTQGSARALASLNWELAAKTGTAQHAGSDVPHSWITVFGPYEDPEIVVTVLVEEGGEGTTSALPVARDMLEQYISSHTETP